MGEGSLTTKAALVRSPRQRGGRGRAPRDRRRLLMKSTSVVIVGAARTPIGTFGGQFAEVEAPRLGAIAVKEALRRAGLDIEERRGIVGEIYLGNVLQAGLGMNP